METRERGAAGPGARVAVGVMTVDDQAVFRQAAREVIEATDGFEYLGEAGSGEEALALAGELDPDLVLVDIRMPGIDGFETARRLSATPRFHCRADLDRVPESLRPGRVVRRGGVRAEGGLRTGATPTVVGRPRPRSARP